MIHDDVNFVRMTGTLHGEASMSMGRRDNLLQFALQCKFLDPQLTNRATRVECLIAGTPDESAFLASLLAGPPRPVGVTGSLVRGRDGRMRLLCRTVAVDGQEWRGGCAIHPLA